MRNFILAFLAFTCTLFAAESDKKTVAPKSGEAIKISEAHKKRWNAVNAKVNAYNAELSRKKLAYYEAKEAKEEVERQGTQLQESVNAELANIMEEAGCKDCAPDAAMEKWVKPEPPVAASPKEEK